MTSSPIRPTPEFVARLKVTRLANASIEFDPMRYRMAFMTPRRLTDIGHWHQHIPFAFALVEIMKPAVFVELGAYKGDSYSAICQAVEAMQLDTRCYAVDNWIGDSHVGNYSDSVFQELSAYNALHYGRFSKLVRSDFDQ